jgi:hypothetical protein
LNNDDLKKRKPKQSAFQCPYYQINKITISGDCHQA